MKHKLNSVLLIDDDEPTNIFTRIILEEAGCTNHIHAAHSGQEALDYLTGDNGLSPQIRPDLILLDINMPAMNGWEFLDEYIKLPKDCQSKALVIMLTTSLNPDDKTLAKLRPEITCFENKPLSEEKIQRILNEYFEDGLFKKEKS
jgi:CheY-like chemotaxis protein